MKYKQQITYFCQDYKKEKNQFKLCPKLTNTFKKK